MLESSLDASGSAKGTTVVRFSKTPTRIMQYHGLRSSLRISFFEAIPMRSQRLIYTRSREQARAVELLRRYVVDVSIRSILEPSVM